MKTLTLDVSKWICGKPDNNTDPANYLGEGKTQMLNDKGYMCCLGQFALQLSDTLEEENMLHITTPHNLDVYIPELVDKNLSNNTLSESAIWINDSEISTVEEKLAQLSKLFAENGYQIDIINDEKMREID